MKERKTLITIFKSDDPEKLVVFRAVSLQNQIRFYLNDTQYISAVEGNEGNSIELGEESEEREESKKSTFDIIKENPKEFIKLGIGITVIIVAIMIYLATIIDNILIYCFIVNIIMPMIDIVQVVVLELKQIDPCLKSKHSAEHMMVNFLEKNKRLPKNMEEIKKCSRFYPNCGSSELIEVIAEKFIQNIITMICAIIVSGIVSCVYDNLIAKIIMITVTFFLVSFVVGRLIKKQQRIAFISIPIKKVLTNIVQCANTTNKVKDTDIILAYSVARVWMQIVYPEFYNKEEDVFWEKYFKVNSEVK